MSSEWLAAPMDDKYNVLRENNLSVSGMDSSHSFYRESSTFLKSKRCPSAPTRIGFNFIAMSPQNQIRIFYITIAKKKFPSVYYGFDSTAFCLLRYAGSLAKGKRYVVYGRLTRSKYCFIECMSVSEVDYKQLCYLLL